MRERAAYETGAVLESRDRKYEPGRRIRLISAAGTRRWEIETIANPRRPRTVGKRNTMSENTLRTKWQRVGSEVDARAHACGLRCACASTPEGLRA